MDRINTSKTAKKIISSGEIHAVISGPIILISTPWPFFNRPSIQLGTLTGFLQKQFPEIKVQALHLYLKIAEKIGYKTYQAISKRPWLAEPLYGALLYPERRKEIKKLFMREADGRPELSKIRFEDLVCRLKKTSEEFIDGMAWGDFGMAGFSVCICQLTASLYFITGIKHRFPHLPIIVGGSMISGDPTYGLLKTFPEIDFIVNGEGELPLSGLVRFLQDPNGPGQWSHIPGVISREDLKDGKPMVFNQLPDLNRLTTPDYDDYFRLIETLKPQNRFFPTLPMELSRGCWWRSRRDTSDRKGCTFCNLNLQWEGYRDKDITKVVSEVDSLTSRYKTLSVAFMDNAVPLRTSHEIFTRIKELGKDLHLFAEIRANTSRRTLRAMREAGTEEIQIGIEALSTGLLKKFNKGTTAIQNLEIMKHCEELRVNNISNLILCFPESNQDDVDETIRTLAFALPFQPLRIVYFWLGLESYVWQHPHAFGLKAIYNHPNYKIIFPLDICRSMHFMIQSYRGDLSHQKKLWRPVRDKVREWKKTYEALHQGPLFSPILSFRDGGDFMIIREKRLRGDPVTHRLVGTSRKIYLFCQHNRSLRGILNRFPEIGEDRIQSFLKMMVDKKLMFEENSRYLSLAVPFH
ncbi:MAG: RiPP maturation radical SAM C-methyltransferase [Deltaproteobacteria bacterium]|nr:RiPP maturation radical SAM C-methyltransferase [Deltaproteobacteria bacterium]